VAEFSFSNQPVWTFSLAGPYNEFELYTYATKIQEALEDITTVSEVSIS
jgi:hypothetical protein